MMTPESILSQRKPSSGLQKESDVLRLFQLHEKLPRILLRWRENLYLLKTHWLKEKKLSPSTYIFRKLFNCYAYLLCN